MPTRSERSCEAATVVLAAAVDGGQPTRARGRSVAAGWSAVLVAVAVVVLAVTGLVGPGSPAGPAAPAVTAAGPEPPTGPTGGARRRPLPPVGGVPPAVRGGALGEADGVVPDGVTVFD